MIEFLPQALASLSSASQLAKSFLDLRDETQINSKVIELQQLIMNAQEQVFSAQSEKAALASKIEELEKECLRLKDWSAEKSRYSRRQIANGVFAYVENEGMYEFQSAHKLCCNCFDKSVKSTLQQESITEGRLLSLVCPNGCPPLTFRHYLQPS